jgi:hypothetical protein
MTDPTDALIKAMSAWASFAVLQLDQDQHNILRACLDQEGMDVHIVARLREGALILDAVSNKDGKRTALFRQDVEPLRPATAFAEPESGGKH